MAGRSISGLGSACQPIIPQFLLLAGDGWSDRTEEMGMISGWARIAYEALFQYPL
jgi:hypothetical protein